MDAKKREWNIRFHRNLKLTTLGLFLLFAVVVALVPFLQDQVKAIGMVVGGLFGLSMLALFMNFASMRMYDRNFIQVYAEFYGWGTPKT